MEKPLEYAINTTTSIETNALLELVNESSRHISLFHLEYCLSVE